MSVNNPKVAALSFSTNGDNTVVAAPSTGISIKVWKVAFTIDGAATLTIYSGASPTTPLSGGYKFTSAGTLVLEAPEGFFLWKAAPATALNFNLSAGVNVGGNIWYTLE